MNDLAVIPLIKYTHPTPYDYHPYGTLWLFMEQSNQQMYIQLSEDENDPMWLRMGFFLETIFEDLFKNKEFINQCLRLDKDKEKNPSLKIIEIIKQHQR